MYSITYPARLATPERLRKVFSGLELSFRSGARGLVGETRVGKTTLLKI